MRMKNTEECYDLGENYYGDEAEQDDEQAVYWYRKAADQGFEAAEKRISKMYAGEK